MSVFVGDLERQAINEEGVAKPGHNLPRDDEWGM
jgi:hypothetical protein